MKRLAFNLIAIALVLGMAQCKKEQPQNQPKTVYITLDVEGSNGSSNSKILVDPSTNDAAVTFETGDQILVGYNGAYVGTLTHNGTNFTGPITIAQSGQQPLYFYFLGNTDLLYNNATDGDWQPYNGETTCSVDIGDQTSGKLPVISMGESNENYIESSTPTTYTAHLRNQCALVKFNVSSVSATASPTCITGFNNVVTIDFTDNSIDFIMEDEGEIRLPANTTSGVHWAILLPQAAMEEKMAFSEDGLCYGTHGAVPEIKANDYLKDGIAVTLDKTRQLYEGYPGAVNGLFSVSATKKVRFSMGNLQYIGSAGTGDADNTGAYWQFAPVQWEILDILTGQTSDKKTVDRDLFGWGTSGYNHNNACYQPWSMSKAPAADYYAYGDGTKNLYDDDGRADWGYNAIRNGGNMENSGWRTLTKDEWSWVLGPQSESDPGTNCRDGIRFAKATVNGQRGLIILPDGWIESTYPLNATNTYNAGFLTNEITSDEWLTILEPDGAVFLPLAGTRDGTLMHNVNSMGFYWSATSNGATRAYNVYLVGGYVLSGYNHNKPMGNSVRLVKDVN